MIKKILLSLAILAATTGIASANLAPYAGLGVGITTNTSNSNEFFGSFRGAPFSVFAGFGGVVSDNFYLAGELNGIVGTAEISDKGQLKTTYGYGASVLPGIMLSDHTLAFVRLGVVSNRFSDEHINRVGGQAGIGLQTSLTQNVDLRGEYDFTAYKDVNKYSFSTSPRADAATLSLVYKFE